MSDADHPCVCAIQAALLGTFPLYGMDWVRAANKSGIARARQNTWLQLVFSVAPGPGASAPGIGSRLLRAHF